MKQYQLTKVAQPGLLHLEESDFLEIRARRGDNLSPVEVELQNRAGYRQEDGFRYDGRRKSVTLALSVRQARELVEQDRTAQGKEFCEECFDFGASADPEQCVRCRVILALHEAGQGDFRKVRIPLPRQEGRMIPAAIALLFVALWGSLVMWSRSAAELEQTRKELAAWRQSSRPAKSLPRRPP